MPALHNLKDEDLQSLAPDAGEALAQQVCLRPPLQNSEIRFEDVKVKTFTFELARLKTWKFGAEIEAMSVDQRRLFDETLVEDEASLPAQLE
ncbi:MAG: hypothetical protein EOO38_02535 [Cytophagaceae bacterium]|nr:MAG: hypothetical protein EOO38_02535 [Cytophagaceae bacterium]